MLSVELIWSCLNPDSSWTFQGQVSLWAAMIQVKSVECHSLLVRIASLEDGSKWRAVSGSFGIKTLFNYSGTWIQGSLCNIQGILFFGNTHPKHTLIQYSTFFDTYRTYRRKFRSQTSDNMERWKSIGGKSQGGEVKKWEDQRRERVRSKKMQVREKVGKSGFTVFFQWFGAPEGRKVTSLKWRVRSQLARWEMNNCTPLWREAHFQVKTRKAHHSQTTFGSWDVEKVHAVVARSWDVEKVHAVVARSTFPSQKCKKTEGSDHFWTFRCRKSGHWLT